MDTLYIGDIPVSYKYAQFGNGYIDLYDKSSARNQTLTYYRIYLNNGGFFYYDTGTRNYGTSTVYFQPINVSQDWKYRQDFPDICMVTFCVAFGLLLLVNLITSCFKKGGLLGGLL